VKREVYKGEYKVTGGSEQWVTWGEIDKNNTCNVQGKRGVAEGSITSDGANNKRLQASTTE